MSILLRFRMLSDEDDNFIREYSIPYETTLLDLHNFICKDLGFDNQSITSFFISDREWNKLAEFTSIDMDIYEEAGGETPPNMVDIPLPTVIRRNHDRLIYLFDTLGERALYLELISSADGGDNSPKVLLSEGPAPEQFSIEGASPAKSSSIYDEIMSDFNEFEGDDTYDDDL